MDSYIPPQQNIPGSEPPQPIPQPAPQTPRPIPQPVTPQPMPTTEPPQSSTPKRQKSLLIAIILIIIMAIATTAIILVFFLKNKEITVNTIIDYCQKHDMKISTDSPDQEIETVYCYSEKYPKSKIIFVRSDSAISESQSLNSTGMFTSIINHGVIMENTEEYKKYYLNLTDLSTDVDNVYLIIEKNSAIIVTGENESTIRQTLIDLGYPDRNWPSSDQTSTDPKTSPIAINQRNVKRRNDMSKIDTALIYYETNNNGQLPTGPSLYIPNASSNFIANGTSIGTTAAKDFIQKYMNDSADSSINTFEDPDSTLYSLYITENLADVNQLTTNLSNNSSSYLIPTSNGGYTIGGSSPFSQHIIYIIPGAMCNNSQPIDAIRATTQRDFAVMYALEGDGNEIYCIDNQ